MDIICINDKFRPETISRVPNLPVAGQMYTVRDHTTLTNGKKAVWLNEITNPKLVDEVTGMQFEPSFDAARFTNLDGTPFTGIIEYAKKGL